MEEKIIYEYCLLRYVADIEREEFVNVGLMMMSKRYRWMHCEIHLDEDRITCFFQKPSIEQIRLQLSVFTKKDVPFPELPVEERYRWLAAVKSAVIQTSPSHPGIIPLSSAISKEKAHTLLNEKFTELFTRLIMTH